MGVDTLPSTAPGLPGHVPLWYSGPSKSPSVPRQPVMVLFDVPSGFTTGARAQPRSSLSAPSGSVGLGTRQLVELPQYSKCPISSENATLYEWAAHSTRVSGLDVLYMGW